MKRSEKLLALVAVLAAVSLGTYALTRYEEKQEEIRSSDAVILSLPADTVESLSWTFAKDGLGFHRGESGWVYDGDEAFPVSEAAVNGILSRFEAMSAAFVIENAEDLGQYGLDDPECTIHLSAAGEGYDIRLGDFSKMDEQRYVDIGDGNVYLVPDDPMDALKTSLSAMIEHDDIPAFETVTALTFRGGENYTVVRNEDSTDTYSGEDLYFARLNGKELPLDTDRVTAYLNAITGSDLLTYVTYNASEEDLARFGLDEPELSVTVEGTCTEEEGGEVSRTCALHLGRDAGEQEAYEAAEEAGEDLPEVTKYIRVGDSRIIYKLDEADYLTLAAASYDDLRHREVFWGDFDTVTQIDITLEGEAHTLTSAPNEEEDGTRVWYYGGEEQDTDKLRRALKALTADRFTEEGPDGKEEIALTLWLDDPNFPQVELRLYRYDGSLCLAEVDGETVCLVDRSAVVDLIEAVRAITLG